MGGAGGGGTGRGSVDPNAIIGPAGFGAQNFTQPVGSFPYTVLFENYGSLAAQDVVVTHQVDADLDWTTFQLGSFGFGPQNIAIPAGLTQYQTTIPYHNIDGSSLHVLVSLDFNVQSGLLTVTFASRHPLTGQWPAGATDGFLPPNDATHIGEGFVQYTIQPKADLSTGVVINQQASIVFDINPPLATDPFINTIDAVAPTSSVAQLPATAPPGITVSWGGTDDADGSGIASFDVYVSDNGGDFTPWQENTVLTSAVFTGQIGHTYGFKSVATDNVGNAQAIPVAAQATVGITVRNQVLFDAPTGVLIVGGTNAADTIMLAPAGTGTTAKLQVTLNGLVISKTILLSAIQQISVLGHEANDTITVRNLNKRLSIEGRGGDDTITLANLTGPVTVDGGAGTRQADRHRPQHREYVQFGHRIADRERSRR